MRKHYIFNCFRNDILVQYHDNNLLTLEIKNRGKKVNIKKGDKFILLEGNSLLGSAFTYYGFIEKVTSEIRESTNSVILKYIVDLVYERKLEDDNLLQDYAYSLKIIKHYNNLSKHFNRQYRMIGKYDYDVIINQRINIQRSAFGILFNSLPREHKYNFLSSLLKIDKDILFSKYDYVEIWFHLAKYIKSNVLVLCEYLLQCGEYLKDLDVDDIESVKFNFNDERLLTSIAEQIKIINENYSTEGETIYEKLKAEILEFKDYNDSFNNLPLPIIL